jgi:hypothetical protein
MMSCKLKLDELLAKIPRQRGFLESVSRILFNRESMRQSRRADN